MGAQGNSRFGWLIHPIEAVEATVVVEEQPVILRGSGTGLKCIIQQRVEPLQMSKESYTWVDLVMGGQAVVVDINNVFVLLSIPGVYRVTVTGKAPDWVVSYQEDARTVEWDTSNSFVVSNTGNSSGGTGGLAVDFGSSPGVAPATPVLFAGNGATGLGLPAQWGKIITSRGTFVFPLYTEQVPF
jgi:hypothetical protein